jgi:hypothetical protein
MSVLPFSNPVDGPRIVPFGEERQPSDVLPNGRPAFRVTQTFDNPDVYWTQHGRPNAKHNALDIGDHHCGDRVLAMADGNAVALVDQYGGKYVRITHSSEWATYYWHLERFAIPTGKTVAVKRGQQIGIVGGTGLAMGVCHLHFETRRNGVHVDPWPLLAQNYQTPDTSTSQPKEAPEMRFGGAALSVEPSVPRYRLIANANFRSQPTTKEPSYGVLPGPSGQGKNDGTIVPVAYWVDGESLGGDDQWAFALMYVGGAYINGYFHRSTLGAPEAAPADCAEAVKAAVTEAIAPLNKDITDLKGRIVAAQKALAG